MDCTPRGVCDSYIKITGCFGCMHLPYFLIYVLLHVFTNIMYRCTECAIIMYRGTERGNSSSFPLPHPQKNVDLLTPLCIASLKGRTDVVDTLIRACRSQCQPDLHGMETAVYSDCMWCELSFAVLRISCPQPLATQHILSFSYLIPIVDMSGTVADLPLCTLTGKSLDSTDDSIILWTC